MHAFHLRRVDEDLEHRPRRGQLRDLLRVDLEGEIRFAALEVIRPQRRVDQLDVQAQNAVFVGIADGVERVFDLRANAERRRVTAAHPAGRA